MYLMEEEDRLRNVERALENLLQVGRIKEVKEGRSLVKVDLGDSLVSDLVPLLQVSTPECSVYISPQVGEQVLFVSPGGVEGRGFALRGIYNKDGLEPKTGKTSSIIEFSDKTKIEYDPEEHILNIDASGSDSTVNIKTKTALVEGTNKVVVKGSKVELGEGALMGVVTMECKCVMTGAPHIEASSVVLAQKQ